MPDLVDIPATWYLKGAIWGARILRKHKRLRRIVATVRDRTMLGAVMKYHLKAVHDVRRFAVNRDAFPDSPLTYESLEPLANSCRDVMADLLEAWPDDIHCTIKLCHGTPEMRKEDWRVYTVARSTPCNRPTEFGLNHSHLIGHNSSFAAVSGANDRRNTWVPRAYSAFLCDDLTAHTSYDCSRAEWQSYFRATAVFPLRYRRAAETSHKVIGFLTFDTMDSGLLSHTPCIFHKWTDSTAYERELSFLSCYHVAGAMADTLACAFYPLLNQTLTKEVADGKDK